jgi:hypothetical protein
MLFYPFEEGLYKPAMFVKPGKIQISSIHYIKVERENGNHIQEIEIVHFAIRDVNKIRDRGFSNHPYVQLNSSFYFTELCSRV